MENASEIFWRVFQNTTYDYFCRMGGAGIYDGFEEWHPAALTVAVGLEHHGLLGTEQVAFYQAYLPHEIVFKCDGLRERTSEAFENLREPFPYKTAHDFFRNDVLFETYFERDWLDGICNRRRDPRERAVEKLHKFLQMLDWMAYHGSERDIYLFAKAEFGTKAKKYCGERNSFQSHLSIDATREASNSERIEFIRFEIAQAQKFIEVAKSVMESLKKQ